MFQPGGNSISPKGGGNLLSSQQLSLNKMRWNVCCTEVPEIIFYSFKLFKITAKEFKESSVAYEG
jgi:hypothetical protein